MWVVILLGILLFLIMEHPVALLCVFVPLGIMFGGSILGFFKEGKLGKLATAMIILVVMVFMLLLVSI